MYIERAMSIYMYLSLNIYIFRKEFNTSILLKCIIILHILYILYLFVHKYIFISYISYIERFNKMREIKMKCFIVLCFIVLYRYCVFYKLKICSSSMSNKSIGASFPKVCVHFMSLSHIWIILAILQTFFIMIYVMVIYNP